MSATDKRQDRLRVLMEAVTGILCDNENIMSFNINANSLNNMIISLQMKDFCRREVTIILSITDRAIMDLLYEATSKHDIKIYLYQLIIEQLYTQLTEGDDTNVSN